jgi:FkbM family methyltransferase
MSDLPLARFRRGGELGQRVEVIRRAPRSLRGAARFGVNELLTGSTASYTLRTGVAGGLELTVRHASSDTWVFREVFLEGLYEQALSLVAGSPSPKIADLGAHVGMFSLRAAAACPGARLVAVEPDPVNLRVLRDVFARNAHPSRDWAIVEGCAATQNGTVTFVEDASYVSHVESVGHPPPGFEAHAERALVEVPAVDVFPVIEGADLVKMDIEGSEWPILESPRLRETRFRNLFLEYHGWASPHPNPRTHAIELLERAGFRLVDAPPAEEHQGVLLATRDA